MQFLSGKPSTIFILTVLFASLISPAVGSELNVLKLPSDQLQKADACSFSDSADPGLCPVKCFRPNPVCGVDNVTYWCGCADARCAGARVRKLGFCEVGPEVSGRAGEAFLLIHMIWLILTGVFILFGLI